MDRKYIEEGIRKFHKFGEDLVGFKMLQKDHYDEKEAFLYRFPSGDVLAYAPDLKENLKDFQVSMDLFEKDFDIEFILEKDKFVALKSEDYTYRILTDGDQAIMESFLSACPEKDKMYGQVSLEDDTVVGAFFGQDLVAVASTWLLENALVDIGILVKPSFKKKGAGISTVSYLIEEVIDQSTPMYRSDYDNPGSMRIARKLGFTEFVYVYRMLK